MTIKTNHYQIQLRTTIKTINHEKRKEPYMTVKMAICDDECLDIEKLESHIAAYAQKNNLTFELTKSQSHREILHTIQQADQYEVLFLDIYMNALNGIELVKQLRSSGCNTRIVFV